MIKDLEVILCEGESYNVEFKENADKSLPSEVCAFANAAGGRVFIGVDDSGRVVGTDVSNTARSRIQDTINQIEPPLNVDIGIHDNIIVLTVPEGANKPYSCAKGFYLRSGPNSQKLERDGIIDFCRNEGRVRYDEIVRRELPISERFDEAAYKRYIRLAKISDVLDREAILKNIDCISEVDGKLYFTNAGALFFRVNDEDVVFRHAGVVCALYKGKDKANILDAKELNGDIVSNIDDAMIFLKKHLRISYKIETLQRENILELPEDALREAIVNAVCHRDYFEKGARVMVEIFDDRVDIVSPGGLCKGITPENFGKVSISRNPIIASMLYRIRYIEQMGTGILRMKQAARVAEVAEPIFDYSGFFTATFWRDEEELADDVPENVPKNEPKNVLDDPKKVINDPVNAPDDPEKVVNDPEKVVNDPVNVPDDPENVVNDPVNVYDDPENVVNDPVNVYDDPEKRLVAIIDLIKNNAEISRPELAEKLNVSLSTIRRDLQKLKSDGIIERIGSDKGGYWRVNS